MLFYRRLFDQNCIITEKWASVIAETASNYGEVLVGWYKLHTRTSQQSHFVIVLTWRLFVMTGPIFLKNRMSPFRVNYGTSSYWKMLRSYHTRKYFPLTTKNTIGYHVILPHMVLAAFWRQPALISSDKCWQIGSIIIWLSFSKNEASVFGKKESYHQSFSIGCSYLKHARKKLMPYNVFEEVTLALSWSFHSIFYTR